MLSPILSNNSTGNSFIFPVWTNKSEKMSSTPTVMKAAQNGGAKAKVPEKKVHFERAQNGLQQKDKTEQQQTGFALSQSEQTELRDAVAKMLQPGKGILAADDSAESMGDRLVKLGLENSAEQRRRYRQLLFTTPNVAKHISAVILQDETFRQCTDKGERLVDQLRRQGIAVGVKIDADLAPLFPAAEEAGSGTQETLTQGLDGLEKRAAEYKRGGCTFVKWRCAYRVSEGTPSQSALEQNAFVMARYAMLCQRHGLVPIVEPDVSCEGAHSIEQCQRASERALCYVFNELARHNVYLEGIVVKTNMVTAGLGAPEQASPERVAQATLLTLRRTLPVAVPGVAFLSGGQQEVVATRNLSAINQLGGDTGSNAKPWRLTFCFGRALQANVMEIWRGSGENVGAAQKQFFHRARANAEAEQGKYEGEGTVSAALSSVNFSGTGPTRYY